MSRYICRFAVRLSLAMLLVAVAASSQPYLSELPRTKNDVALRVASLPLAPRIPVGAVEGFLRSFVTVPRDANEISKVFKVSANRISAAKLSEFRRSFDRAEQLAREQRSFTVMRPVTSPGSIQMADDFLHTYESSEYGALTLIGHNDSGVFYFTDGSSVNLTQIPANEATTLAIISCNSSEYSDNYAGLPTLVTYSIAYRTAQLYKEKISSFSDQVLTLELSQSLLTEAHNRARIENGLRIAAPPALIVGVGAVLVNVNGS